MLSTKNEEVANVRERKRCQRAGASPKHYGMNYYKVNRSDLNAHTHKREKERKWPEYLQKQKNKFYVGGMAIVTAFSSNSKFEWILSFRFERDAEKAPAQPPTVEKREGKTIIKMRETNWTLLESLRAREREKRNDDNKQRHVHNTRYMDNRKNKRWPLTCCHVLNKYTTSWCVLSSTLFFEKKVNLGGRIFRNRSTHTRARAHTQMRRTRDFFLKRN